MSVILRPPTPADISDVGRIVYEAFATLSHRHHFRPDFPSVEVATGLAGAFIQSPDVFGVIAEEDGKVIGSNFLTEWDAIRGVGPITIDPAHQGKGTGRRLMQAVLDRGKNAEGIRLVQDAFNTASMSLYASLGFEAHEPLVLIEGAIREPLPAGTTVRPLEDGDLAACAALCQRTHGIDRTNEIRHRSPMFMAFVAVREGRAVGYTTCPHFWPMNHGMAETLDDLKALLIGASTSHTAPLCFLLPIRQAELFRWCLAKGMRVLKPMTLMTMGRYEVPRGAFLPSVLY